MNPLRLPSMGNYVVWLLESFYNVKQCVLNGLEMWSRKNSLEPQ